LAHQLSYLSRGSWVSVAKREKNWTVLKTDHKIEEGFWKLVRGQSHS